MRAAGQSGHEGTTGAYASWASEPREQVITAKIGISYVDVKGAENNLETEAAGQRFRRHSPGRGRCLEQGTRTDRGVRRHRLAIRECFIPLFITACSCPRSLTTRTGAISDSTAGFTPRLTGHHVYTNYSGWDIYRSEIPLLAMIEPQRMQDMAQSIVLMYEQGGWIDRWPQINLYTNDMVGSPLSIVIATAWLDGLHDFDIDKAWEGMLKDATEAPPAGRPYLGEEGMEWLNKLHYLPADKVDYGSVAKTQEYSLACAALYRLASIAWKNRRSEADV